MATTLDLGVPTFTGDQSQALRALGGGAQARGLFGGAASGAVGRTGVRFQAQNRLDEIQQLMLSLLGGQTRNPNYEALSGELGTQLGIGQGLFNAELYGDVLAAPPQLSVSAPAFGRGGGGYGTFGSTLRGGTVGGSLTRGGAPASANTGLSAILRNIRLQSTFAGARQRAASRGPTSFRPVGA